MTKAALLGAGTATLSLQNITLTGNRLDLSSVIGSPPPVGQNASPVAVDDTATAVTGETIDINVLGNDYDPDGSQTDLVIESSSQGVVSPDGKSLSYTAPAQVPSGGTDSFTYTIRDLHGDTDRATVTVTVTDPAQPPATGDIAMTANILEVVTEAKGRNLKGTATVQVVEVESGDAVPNATVMGTWTLPGFQPASTSATTDASGIATFVATAKARAGEFDFSVDTVTKAGYVYQPSN
jgi:hypothetical protein